MAKNQNKNRASNQTNPGTVNSVNTDKDTAKEGKKSPCRGNCPPEDR